MLAHDYRDRLQIVMRTYFEKPRTTVGWKGLVFDPHLDGSNDIGHGLQLARQLLLDINRLGLATATEFLDTTSFLYLADLISWGAIGARTTESQVHRQLASALPCPIGFKNGTDGNIRVAIDAIQASEASHLFTAPGSQGGMVVIKSEGNPTGHIICAAAPAPIITRATWKRRVERLARQGLTPRLMVDCSHGNSQKLHKNQIRVAGELCRQLGKAATPSPPLWSRASCRGQPETGAADRAGIWPVGHRCLSVLGRYPDPARHAGRGRRDTAPAPWSGTTGHRPLACPVGKLNDHQQ